MHPSLLSYLVTFKSYFLPLLAFDMYSNPFKEISCDCPNCLPQSSFHLNMNLYISLLWKGLACPNTSVFGVSYLTVKINSTFTVDVCIETLRHFDWP